MNPEELFGPAYAAVSRMDRWMRDVVRGFRGFSVAERRSFAVELAYHLCLGSCPCGLPSCSQRHTVVAWDPAEMGLPLFVEQAVIGPTGLQANSVAQGMFYRLILGIEEGLLVALVELNRCADPGCPQEVYEAVCCPGDGCPSVFRPEETEVIAQERLLIQGVYLPVRRWRCPGGHYFRQRLCRDRREIDFQDDPGQPGGAVRVVRHRVEHGPKKSHDHCPWQGCPQGKPRHPQRGTTLWVRCELAGGGPPGGPTGDPGDPADPTDPDALQRLAAFEDGARDWWDALGQATRDALRAAFVKEVSPPPVAGEDPLRIADWLLGGPQAQAPVAPLRLLRAAITRSLQARGLEG